MKALTNRTEAPRFHSKEIKTQVSLIKGDYLLIGTWKPTGKPEYLEKDLTHVVFVTANVQSTGGYGLKEAQVKKTGENEKAGK